MLPRALGSTDLRDMCVCVLGPSCVSRSLPDSVVLFSLVTLIVHLAIITIYQVFPPIPSLPSD
jgi:hypothetical protein